MFLTVIICTYNPRVEYLNFVLDALRRQTIDQSLWELIVVDNASQTPVEDLIQFNWHKRARVVHEAELGLTSARLRGIAEASGEIIVFVDDDNVLQDDYLDQVCNIFKKWPQLGVIGAGQITGVFEEEPHDSLRPYLCWLTINQLEDDIWANQFSMHLCPRGAGLSVRVEAARIYVDQIINNEVRRAFGRRGDLLTSAEDADLVWTIMENGWGAGRFACLKMDHLIISARVKKSYLDKIIEAHFFSTLVLKYVHGDGQDFITERFFQRLARWSYERTLSSTNRWAYKAERRGRKRALEFVKHLKAKAD